jgi:hypothetical protein
VAANVTASKFGHVRLLLPHGQRVDSVRHYVQRLDVPLLTYAASWPYDQPSRQCKALIVATAAV